MAKNSIQFDFISKLISNIIGILTNIGFQAIVPRTLGPSQYGNFSFLNNFFEQIVNFLEINSSTAYYTKLSHRKKETKLFFFYIKICLILFFLLFLITGVICFSKLTHFLLPGQTSFFAFCALCFTYLHWLLKVLQKSLDALNLTVLNEKLMILFKLVSFIILILLFWNSQLNLLNLYLYSILILFSFSLLFFFLILKNLPKASQRESLPRSYLKEFWIYIKPLFWVSLFGLIANQLDRLILQHFYGSKEQGLFSFSFQLTAISALFTASMTPLLTRELSIAYGNNNQKEQSRLLMLYLPFFYAISSYFSCFIFLHSEFFIQLLGGNDYLEASIIVAIMIFYPIHQTYGQFCGSFFYANGKTKLYSILSICTTALGLVMTYFLLAPSQYGGLNFAGIGLALKFLLLQIVSVNISLFFITKTLKLSWRFFFFQQIYCTAIMYAWAWINYNCFNSGQELTKTTFLLMFLEGISYTIGFILALNFIPKLFGVDQKVSQEIKNLISYLYLKVQKKY